MVTYLEVTEHWPWGTWHADSAHFNNLDGLSSKCPPLAFLTARRRRLIAMTNGARTFPGMRKMVLRKRATNSSLVSRLS